MKPWHVVQWEYNEARMYEDRMFVDITVRAVTLMFVLVQVARWF